MREPLDKKTQVTNILLQHSARDPKAIADLLALIYDELRALARKHMRRERPDHTLSATALVHEAYVRLAQTAEGVATDGVTPAERCRH